MVYEYPRVTRSFRAFTDLDRPKCIKQNAHSVEERRKWEANQFKNGLTWPEVNLYIQNEMGSKSTILKQMQQLRSLATDICGGDQSKEVVDEAAVLFLQLFLEEKHVMQKHLQMLKQMFGNVTSNLANKILQCVQHISSCLTELCIEYLKGGTKHLEACSSRFGEHVQYLVIQRAKYQPDVSGLEDVSSELGSEVLKQFTMKYDDGAPFAQSKEELKKQQSRKNGFGRSWLEKELRKFSIEEFCEAIVSVLKSNRSSDELQNEMFDLLGFARFELIQLLLEHREDIVRSTAAIEEKRLINSSQSLLDERRPNYGCQVIVQSEQEKLLMKQALREEKKLHRIAAGRTEEESDEEPGISAAEYRQKRDAAVKARSAPVFRDKIRPAQSRAEVYPHVYDAQRQAQQTSGFISGVKIMLPEGVQRIDNKICEEVSIPVSQPAPPDVGSRLVQIASLDKIGQLAFQGMKTLNRIQSVVFDTAYHTNENLLICAPTGAGKTNVAMLTVVNQIRQFIEHDVIKKDQFKVVYVAPMKALAAEMTQNFSRRLSCLGISVKELTGDMQLTKTEILQTQMLVTTPEKWDVVTRKGTGDVALTNLVKLLIIDEVHLLHGDRGPVVEALVARTLRLVESSQSMIRIVGLSATLPNYLDVTRFLRVNPSIGLFFFDSRFRPVPLSTTFIGVKSLKPLQQMNEMDQVCYEKVISFIQKGHQVMVFVHTRNATSRTATVLKEMAIQKNQLQLFEPQDSSMLGLARKAMSKSRNKQLGELFNFGFAIHHAGMLRADRNLVEKYFSDGLIKVLVCTSTLAWGVNLPAHGVIIRGTEIYDAKHGSFVDLSILDVLQIFGRAGRPQFDKSGHGVIITAHAKLSHYLSLLTNQYPIESNFINCLADNLNAEVALGTIANVDEAVEWLSYTYLFVRMRMNPQVYGINYQDVTDDCNLVTRRRDLIDCAAKALDKARMIRYNVRTGDLSITDLGRTASHFYIKYDTVEIFNTLMSKIMSQADILAMISQSQEFQQLKVRDDEMQELDDLTHINCNVAVAGGSENVHGKVNILLQTYLSRGHVNSFSLMSDLAYVTQNAVRISRALFEIELRKNNSLMAGRFLMLSKMLEQQQWDDQSPMRQFRILGADIIQKIEDRKLTVDKLRDMDIKEIGLLLRHHKMGVVVKRCAEEFPLLDMEAILQPITRTVLRIRLQIQANFRWNDKVHGKTSEAFYIWIEDPECNHMYHSEFFLITKKQVIQHEVQELVMTIPLMEPLPPQYYVRATSDRWLYSSTTLALSFQNLILPDSHPPHTDLLELQPLPVTALNNSRYEMLYTFTHFNPIQTQIFHCLYHTDNNVLLGAPTGSGKTIVAEIAIFRVFEKHPGSKVVYIAPLKALVRERIHDWKIRLESKLNKKVVELTGDVTPDINAITQSDLIVTTPEKWDGISRSWQTRNYVRDVALMVIDEIHLLGEDRGPVLEVIVSRTNYIASQTSRTVRIIGLSTALANARDLASWLKIGQMGLYNFRPSVRPVPLEVHISGFPGKHYCPRMATMNKPTFQAIRQYSPAKPVLVFVSSRRQTRLTALDLIAYLAAEDNPKQWLHLPEHEMDQIVSGVKDSNLKLTLAFGIGMHHAGLQERDRKTVEELFVNQKIQLLVATATLAWGVNFPAHLVVIKGTEYYDGKVKRYVDMPITDVLQMMGRAGRPQFDDNGVAMVLVHDVKKNFYKKFLYEPFPVESSLLEVLPDHLNAEVVAGTVQTKQDALNYLTWTYFFLRLHQNPTYYNLEGLAPENVNAFLSNLAQRSLNVLAEAYCLQFDEDERGVQATAMGRIASYYYLSHQTMQLLKENLGPDLSLEKLLEVVSDVHEYEQMPVRHNEDILNGELAKSCRLPVNQYALDSPHTKTLLLLQAHFSRLHLPCADYFTDLKSVLDQAIRILQAMIDVCADHGWLATTLRIQQIMQMVIQGRWLQESALLTLPHLEPHHLYIFNKKNLGDPALQGKNIRTLPSLRAACFRKYETLAGLLRQELNEGQIEQVFQVLCDMPTVTVEVSIRGSSEEEQRFVQPPSRNNWIDVHAGEEYTVIAQLRCLNRRRDTKKIHCPRFPRGKDEGWFLVLGSVESGELLALKRVQGSNHKHRLTFFAPSALGRVILTLYLMSDGYLGLDQQYYLQLNVISQTAVSNV